MESASKIMFYVCMIVAIPLWFEADYVLKLWLGNYPEYTITFLRISLLMTMFSSSSVLNCAVLQSANKIRREQLFVASINLMTLPLSYMALKVGLGPVSPFVIATILQFVALLVDVMVVQYELKKNMSFFFGVLIRLYFTLLISSIPPLVFTYYIEPSFVRVILTSIIGILSSTVFMYIFCLNKNERLKFRLLIHKYIKSNEN
jgi:hypothetical protein